MVEMMIEEICDSGNIKSISIERSLSHYWASGANRIVWASGANRIGSSKISLMGLYYKNIMRKALDKHPLLGKMPFAFPVFSIIYPVRWWIRSLMGKREKVNLRHVILMGKKRKQLYDRLDSVYPRSSQNSQPNSDASDVNSRKERGRVFRIARSDPPPAF